MYGKATFIGRLTKDPELKKTSSGKSVVSFDLAVSNNYNKDVTYFHKFVAWNQQAEFVSNYIRKGSQVFIESEPQNRSYDDKDGKKVYITEYIVNTIKSLGASSNSNGSQQSQQTYYNEQTNKDEPILQIDESDLPF